MRRGIFVSLEGVEGAGKSTLLRGLVEKLPSLGRELIVTREPGATDIGKTIRALLLSTERAPLAPEAEVCLFAADRAQHIAEVIAPGLTRGALVLCDRYVHSTLAYQGFGRGLPYSELKQVMDFATGGLLPDLVLLLDLDPRVGLSRVAARASKGGDKEDSFEQESLDFHRRIRNGFLSLAEQEGSRFVIIDAALSPEEILNKAYAAVASVHARLNA